jgi:hypothetical protein
MAALDMDTILFRVARQIACMSGKNNDPWSFPVRGFSSNRRLAEF